MINRLGGRIVIFLGEGNVCVILDRNLVGVVNRDEVSKAQVTCK